MLVLSHVIAGYLAVSLFLNESHELLLLLVNTVLKVRMFIGFSTKQHVNIWIYSGLPMCQLLQFIYIWVVCLILIIHRIQKR